MFLEIHILRARKIAKEEKPGRDGGWTRARGGPESHQKETELQRRAGIYGECSSEEGTAKSPIQSHAPSALAPWEALQSFPNSQEDGSGLHLPRV